MTAVGQRFEVFAPATVANVGPGFDCFGFSLGEPGDTVSVAVTDTPGVRITDLQCDFGDLPIQAELNTAGRAAIHIWSSAPETAAKHGLDMTLHKGLPLCSGLGSSAASAVAGAVAAMHALAASTGAQYDPQKVLDAAFDGESLASGTPHADNIAPALYGGFTIVQSAHPLRIARFEPSLPCRVALVTPDWEISTKHARVILPTRSPCATPYPTGPTQHP